MEAQEMGLTGMLLSAVSIAAGAGMYLAPIAQRSGRGLSSLAVSVIALGAAGFVVSAVVFLVATPRTSGRHIHEDDIFGSQPGSTAVSSEEPLFSRAAKGSGQVIRDSESPLALQCRRHGTGSTRGRRASRPCSEAVPVVTMKGLEGLSSPARIIVAPDPGDGHSKLFARKTTGRRGQRCSQLYRDSPSWSSALRRTIFLPPMDP